MKTNGDKVVERKCMAKKKKHLEKNAEMGISVSKELRISQ